MRKPCVLFCLDALLLVVTPSAQAGPVEFQPSASATYRLTGSIDAIDGTVMTGARSKNQDGSINTFDVWVRTHRVAATASEGLVTITAALADAAVKTGDTIVIGNGIYREHELDFHGKTVSFRSEHGPALTIIDCEGKGRAMTFSLGGSPSIDGITFRNCTPSSGDGGAILASNNTSLKITRSVFLDNGANNGGAVAVADGSLVIEQTEFRGNLASAKGGAVMAGNSATRIDNCLFTKNEADQAAGVWVEGSANVLLRHNTFHNNTLTVEALPIAIGLHQTNNALIANSILWNDDLAAGYQQVMVTASSGVKVVSSTANHGTKGVSCAGGCTGVDVATVVNKAPLFVFADDQHLAPESPAINHGQTIAEVELDADGVHRPQGTASDMGAYEFTTSNQLPVIARTPARIEFRPPRLPTRWAPRPWR